MRALTCTVMSLCGLFGLSQAALAAWPDADNPDGYCTNLLGQSDPAPWVIDKDVATSAHLGSKGLTHSMVQKIIDATLQQAMAMSRPMMRTRVVDSDATNCSVSDLDGTPCVEARTNAEETSLCGCPTCSSVLAWGGCDLFTGCHVVICSDHLSTRDVNNGNLQKTLLHEFGHAFGLSHTNAEVSGTFAGCGASTSTANCGSTSDGCAAEAMCSVRDCIGAPFPTEGDALGLRSKLPPPGQAFSRKVYWQSDGVENGMGSPTRVPFTSRTAAYAPRIDCSEVITPLPANRCAAVFATRTSLLNNISVVRLNTPAGAAGWSTQSIVKTLATKSVMAPDIAITPTGDVAYVVYVTANLAPVLVRIPLNGAATTTLSLSTVSREVIRPVLPPRITVTDGFVQVLVYNRNTDGLVVGNPIPRLITINGIATSASVSEFFSAGDGIDIDSENTWSDAHAFLGEYDFDCTPGIHADRCVIGAVFLGRSSVQVGALQSIRYAVASVGGTAQLLDEDWSVNRGSAARQNAVVGLAQTPFGLFISASSRVLDNSTKNTLVARFAGDAVSNNILSSHAHKSDAQTCAQASAHGLSLGAASMHGGYSISWCPHSTCGGSYGTVESVSWGNHANGDTRCF